MENLTFYKSAEDDFYFLKSSMESGNTGNIICSLSQSICERFLKQLIVNYINEDSNNKDDFEKILKSNNIEMILNFIEDNLKDFITNVEIRNVSKYSDYGQPGSYPIDEDGIRICWNSVKICKVYVDHYIDSHPNKINEFRSK